MVYYEEGLGGEMSMSKSEEFLACNYCYQPIYHKCGRKIISFKGELYWQLESQGEVSFEEIKKLTGKVALQEE